MKYDDGAYRRRRRLETTFRERWSQSREIHPESSLLRRQFMVTSHHEYRAETASVDGRLLSEPCREAVGDGWVLCEGTACRAPDDTGTPRAEPTPLEKYRTS